MEVKCFGLYQSRSFLKTEPMWAPVKPKLFIFLMLLKNNTKQEVTEKIWGYSKENET